MSPGGSQIRIVRRVIDSIPELHHNELISRIRTGLLENIELTNEQIKLPGAPVTYKNIPRSLFISQNKAICLVLAAIFLMLTVALRELKLAAIELVPGFLNAGAVLNLLLDLIINTTIKNGGASR